MNKKKKINRLMDGICVLDGKKVHLLCDDYRSLMQQLCKTQLVVMRSYEFNINWVSKKVINNYMTNNGCRVGAEHFKQRPKMGNIIN